MSGTDLCLLGICVAILAILSLLWSNFRRWELQIAMNDLVGDWIREVVKDVDERIAQLEAQLKGRDAKQEAPSELQEVSAAVSAEEG